MTKVNVLIALMMLGISLCGVAQSPEDGRVIFYHEYEAVNQRSFYIFNEYHQVVRIKNNSYYVYHCREGERRFFIGNTNTSYPLEVERGKTYYVKVVVVSNNGIIHPSLEVVSEKEGRASFEKSTMKRLITISQFTRFDKDLSHNFTPIAKDTFPSILPDEVFFEYLPKNRIGIGFLAGGGFNKINLFELEDGRMSSITFGGGTGFNAFYGRELADFLDVELGWSVAVNSLRPSITNGSGVFTKSFDSLTPSVVIPFTPLGNRFKLSAGLDYYYNNKFTVEYDDINFSEDLVYGKTTGTHFGASYEYIGPHNISISVGGKFYQCKFSYSHSERYNIPDAYELNSMNGAGFIFSSKLAFHF